MSVGDDDDGGGVGGDSDQGWWWTTTSKAKHHSFMGLLKIFVHEIHDFFPPSSRPVEVW